MALLIELCLHFLAFSDCLFISALAVQMIRVITGCGSHGFGKSKLKQSVRFNPPHSIQIFILLHGFGLSFHEVVSKW
jgi:hypothetical protein